MKDKTRKNDPSDFPGQAGGTPAPDQKRNQDHDRDIGEEENPNVNHSNTENI